MSFTSNKTQILELVDTPGRRKPSNFGYMICAQEAYPISLCFGLINTIKAMYILLSIGWHVGRFQTCIHKTQFLGF